MDKPRGRKPAVASAGVRARAKPSPIANKIVCADFAHAGAFKDMIAKGVEGRAASAVRFGGGGIKEGGRVSVELRLKIPSWLDDSRGGCGTYR